MPSARRPKSLIICGVAWGDMNVAKTPIFMATLLEGLFVGARFADAPGSLEHGLERIHHEADAGQVGVDGAAGADDRIGQGDSVRVPGRGVEDAHLRPAALGL